MAKVFVVMEDPYFQDKVQGIFTDQGIAKLVKQHEGGQISEHLIDDESIIKFVQEKEYKRVQREKTIAIRLEEERLAKEKKINESIELRNERFRSNPVTVNMWRKSNKLPPVEGPEGNVVINQINQI